MRISSKTWKSDHCSYEFFRLVEFTYGKRIVPRASVLEVPRLWKVTIEKGVAQRLESYINQGWKTCVKAIVIKKNPRFLNFKDVCLFYEELENWVQVEEGSGVETWKLHKSGVKDVCQSHWHKKNPRFLNFKDVCPFYGRWWTCWILKAGKRERVSGAMGRLKPLQLL